MSIAVWTTGSERVKRKHYSPENIDTKGAIVTDEEPNSPDVEPWVDVEEYFNETDGFYYEVSDPLAGAKLSAEEKIILDYAKEVNHAQLEQYVEKIV